MAPRLCSIGVLDYTASPSHDPHTYLCNLLSSLNRMDKHLSHTNLRSQQLPVS